MLDLDARCFVLNAWPVLRFLVLNCNIVAIACSFVDAHLPQPSYDDQGWAQVLPLLRLIFPPKDVKIFEIYRFVQSFDARKRRLFELIVNAPFRSSFLLFCDLFVLCFKCIYFIAKIHSASLLAETILCAHCRIRDGAVNWFRTIKLKVKCCEMKYFGKIHIV